MIKTIPNLKQLEATSRSDARARGVTPGGLTYMKGDIGFDIESTGLNPREDKIILVSLKPKGLSGHYIDARHMDLGLLSSLLAPYFDNPDITLVGHNIQFDLEFMLIQLGLYLDKTRLYDTMSAELEILGLGSAEASKHKETQVSLSSVARRYGLAVSKEERNWFIDLDKRPAWNEPIPQEQYVYARQDVSVIHRIKALQEPRIKKLGLEEVVELEMSAKPAEVLKSYWGLSVDKERCEQEACKIKEEADALERTLHEALDVHVLGARSDRYTPVFESYRRWSWLKDKVVADAKVAWDEAVKGSMTKATFKNWSEMKSGILDRFYDKHPKRSKPAVNKAGVSFGSGQQLKDGFAGACGVALDNVREETLLPLSRQHPVIKTYLDWKQRTTFLGKYGEDSGFLDKLDGNNRVYPEWKQKAAGTGREGCANPNIQNFPRKGVGAGMRACIVPAKGCVFVGADFNSEEARIIAGMSGDKNMKLAFDAGKSLHGVTGMLMFSLNLEEGIDVQSYLKRHNAVVYGKEIPGKSMYDVAKTCNFALFYGGGAAKLADLLGISVEAAKGLKELHYQTFKTAIDWVRNQRKVAYARTASGRIRNIPYPKMEDVYTSLKMTPQDVGRWDEAREKFSRRVYNRELGLANAPIQGTGADIMKYTLATMWQSIGYNKDIRLVLSVHDEVVLEVLDDPQTIKRAQSELKYAMESAQRKYMRGVAIGVVEPIVSRVWEH